MRTADDLVHSPVPISTLEEAGYISIEKSFIGKKAQTVFRLTEDGRTAFTKHVDALREITAGLK